MKRSYGMDKLSQFEVTFAMKDAIQNKQNKKLLPIFAHFCAFVSAFAASVFTCTLPCNTVIV